MGFILLILVVVIYFLPTIIAYKKDKKQKGAIFALNLLTGWMLGIGWIASLIWSLTND